MEFLIETTNGNSFSDTELSDLLKEVYVEEGYTREDQAKVMFEADAIRSRGMIITASHIETKRLAGLVIMVPPTSSAKKMAQEGEMEVHLLAVKQDYRNKNLGHKLMNELILLATNEGYNKAILWTQESMIAAQHLYEKLGFTHISNFNANGRVFYLFNRAL